MDEWEGLFRVAIAALLGGTIGIERELRGKEAGLRTLALVAGGAATFMVLGILLIESDMAVGNTAVRYDLTRIIGETVGGIGFLGGAIIFRRENRSEGVTTAAAVWTATGIGMSSGTGNYILAVGGTAIIVGILYGFRIVQSLLGLKEPADDVEPDELTEFERDKNE